MAMTTCLPGHPLKRKLSSEGYTAPLLRVKKLSCSAKLPTRESVDAAGYDLYRYVRWT